jgi:phosphoribosylformylglycinamidine synthase
MLITAPHQHVAEIEQLAGELSFFAARIGTTGGPRLEIAVDGQPFISASVDELRTPWATALEATLHNEVMA